MTKPKQTPKKTGNFKKKINKKQNEDSNLIKIISVLTGLFLLFFLIGYLTKSIDQDDYYNGIEFTKLPQQWQTSGLNGEEVEKHNYWQANLTINNQPVSLPFYNHPKDLEDIPYSENAADVILQIMKDQGGLYLAVDPDVPAYLVISGVQIARITGTRYNILGIPTKAAFYSEEQISEDQPSVTCEDASKNIIVVRLMQGDINSISREEYCITITAKDEKGAYMVSDLFVYKLLKIME